MAFRLNIDRSVKHLDKFMVSDSTGGCIHTTDYGNALLTLSSNKVGLMQGTSLAPTIPVAGILAYLVDSSGDVSTGSSAGSSHFAMVMPIGDYDVCKVDFSTAWSDSTVNMVVSSNIGKYFGNCSSNGIAAGGSSVAGNGNLGKYINISTAANVAATSMWLRLVGIPASSDSKYGFFQIPSSNLTR